MCDCFKSNGSTTKEKREAFEFSRIELDDNIDLVLTQDTINSIGIEAGKHLQKLIKAELSGGNTLYIHNDNKCNWVRSYDMKITAYVHFKTLTNLTYRGSGNITCTDTIRSPVIYIENWNGSGIIDLTVNSKEAYIKEHIGPADFFIKGKTEMCYLWAAGYGRMDCSHLLSDKSTVINKSTGNCYINASSSLSAEIYYIGNIYYSGNPSDISKKIEGSGKLVKL